MQIYVFFVVCGFVAHLTGADIAYEKYNDRDPKNDPFADTDWQPLPDSETELKMLVKDMQQLVRVTFDRYNNQKGDIHDDFMQMLASYATCKPQEGHPAPMIPNKTLYENNPLMQQYEIPRRLFRMAMVFVKNFTKTRLFHNFVKGGLEFSLDVAAFSAPLLAKVPECAQSPMCTLTAKGIEGSARGLLESNDLDFYAELVAETVNWLAQGITYDQ